MGWIVPSPPLGSGVLTPGKYGQRGLGGKGVPRAEGFFCGADGSMLRGSGVVVDRTGTVSFHFFVFRAEFTSELMVVMSMDVPSPGVKVRYKLEFMGVDVCEH